MIVKLTYFRTDGALYRTVEHDFPDEPVWMTATRVKQAMMLKRLPELEIGHRDYNVLVESKNTLHLVLVR